MQIAKAQGAHVGGTPSRANRALVDSPGAHECADYRTIALGDAVRNVDLVVDPIRSETQEASWALMAPGGLPVSVVSDPAVAVTSWSRGRGVP